MSNYRKTAQLADSVTFKNPLDPRDWFRVRVTSTTKNNPVQSTLIRNEIVANRIVDFPESNVEGKQEVLSVRLLTSGSYENSAELIKLLDQVIANVEVIKSDLANGFVPYEAALPITP